MADRYSLIKIGATYLTRNGLSNGSRCKTQITGLNLLKLPISGNTQQQSDGTVVSQYAPTKGIRVDVNISYIEKTVYDTIVSSINAAISGGTALAFEITGDTGDFIGSAVPAVPDAIKFSGKFSGDILQDVTFSFITL